MRIQLILLMFLIGVCFSSNTTYDLNWTSSETLLEDHIFLFWTSYYEYFLAIFGLGVVYLVNVRNNLSSILLSYSVVAILIFFISFNTAFIYISVLCIVIGLIIKSALG